MQEVKIDRSFVRDLVHDPDDEIIVRAVADLGRSLHLDVVAEGVEDLATWRRLQQFGAIIVQGYHLSRPMPPANFEAWMAEHRAAERGTAPQFAPPAQRAAADSAMLPPTVGSR